MRVHSTHKYSPAELLYGRRLVLPADLSLGPPPAALDRQGSSGYPSDLREVLRDLHYEVAKNLRSASNAMKIRYDNKAKITAYSAAA
ncbi:Arginine--tRNA ligase [Frankliniella fusca]|uniref:Arginine--tRNA ligase n=1 Tax=Frankliniella fusca TaxID=407009 RepID=A0AAE1L4X4_9NEOP|nr:Arginine--tRNA ligase [Frankliniella fusca]